MNRLDKLLFLFLFMIGFFVLYLSLSIFLTLMSQPELIPRVHKSRITYLAFTNNR